MPSEVKYLCTRLGRRCGGDCRDPSEQTPRLWMTESGWHIRANAPATSIDNQNPARLGEVRISATERLDSATLWRRASSKKISPCVTSSGGTIAVTG